MTPMDKHVTPTEGQHKGEQMFEEGKIVVAVADTVVAALLL